MAEGFGLGYIGEGKPDIQALWHCTFEAFWLRVRTPDAPTLRVLRGAEV